MADAGEEMEFKKTMMKILYVAALILLLLAGFSMLVYGAGIAAAVSGSGNTSALDGFENVPKFFAVMASAAFVIAIVLQIQINNIQEQGAEIMDSEPDERLDTDL